MIKNIVLTYGVKVDDEFFYKDKFFTTFESMQKFILDSPNLSYFKMRIVREKKD